MDAVKEQIFEAVTEMDVADAARLWQIIERDILEDATGWALIPEPDPDEIDLLMLGDIERDLDHRAFVSSDEAKRILGLDRPTTRDTRSAPSSSLVPDAHRC